MHWQNKECDWILQVLQWHWSGLWLLGVLSGSGQCEFPVLINQLDKRFQKITYWWRKTEREIVSSNCSSTGFRPNCSATHYSRVFLIKKSWILLFLSNTFTRDKASWSRSVVFCMLRDWKISRVFVVVKKNKRIYSVSSPNNSKMSGCCNIHSFTLH